MSGRRWQRVAAYAVIIRDGEILLSRLAPRVSRRELWTLPGGGIDHGEHPRDAVVREVYEETGLRAEVGETVRPFSLHLPDDWREGRRVDAHSLRLVFEGRVPAGSPPPRVVEVDGSTMASAWHPLADVLDGTVPTVALVGEALAAYRPARVQRVAAYGLALRGDGAAAEVLLTRISPHGHHHGSWTLPGGGVDHGEPPADAVRREVAEECGLEPARIVVGAVLGVHDVHLRGNAPSGRDEDFHGVHLIYALDVPADAVPHVAEADGTTDAVAWVPVADVLADRLPVLDVVHEALRLRAGLS
ncbi:NUDIX domain-containing protein [Nocardioides sp.]|uniref:NUDIX hydrolase n=1 Tax=Nocardioides sp. TaxID=35761 RepID=UPI003517FBAB